MKRFLCPLPLLMAACQTPGLPIVTSPHEALAPAWSAPGTSFGMEMLGDLASAQALALVERALAENPDPRAALAKLEGREAALAISAGGRWPGLSFDGNFQRSQRNLIAFGLNSQPTVSVWNAGFNASWELDLWGRIGAGVDSAEQELLAAAFDERGVRTSLTGAVLRNLLDLGQARALAALAEETLSSWSRSEAHAARRFDAGVGPALDLYLMRSNLAAAEAALTAARAGEDLAERSLERLLGHAPDGALALVSKLPAAPSTGLPDVAAQALALRPDLAAAEARTRAALARSRMRRAELWPRLTLTGSTGWTSTQPEDLGQNAFSIWSFMAGISAPLFQGGILRAQVAGADAETRAALLQWESAVLLACFEVEGARIRSVTADGRSADLERARDEAARAEALAQQQYEAGLVNVTLVLEAQRRRLQAEADLIRVLRERHEARLDLWLACGGPVQSNQGLSR